MDGPQRVRGGRRAIRHRGQGCRRPRHRPCDGGRQPERPELSATGTPGLKLDGSTGPPSAHSTLSERLRRGGAVARQQHPALRAVGRTRSVNGPPTMGSGSRSAAPAPSRTTPSNGPATWASICFNSARRDGHRATRCPARPRPIRRMLGNGRSNWPGGGACLEQGACPNGADVADGQPGHADRDGEHRGRRARRGRDGGSVVDGQPIRRAQLRGRRDWRWWTGSDTSKVEFSAWQRLGQDQTGTCDGAGAP